MQSVESSSASALKCHETNQSRCEPVLMFLCDRSRLLISIDFYLLHAAARERSVGMGTTRPTLKMVRGAAMAMQCLIILSSAARFGVATRRSLETEGRTAYGPLELPPGMDQTGDGTIVADHHPDDESRQWFLDWLESSTGSKRRAANVRRTYFNATLSKEWISCARDHGHDTTLPRLELPKGIKVLFFGNSMVRQAAEATMMSFREESIASQRYVYLTADQKKAITEARGQSQKEFGGCPCSVLRYGGSYQYSCPVVNVLDFLVDPSQGTLICDSQAIEAGNSFNEPYCSDDVAKLQLKDGTVIAQVTNAPVFAHELTEFTAAVFDLQLNDFDYIVVNNGNDLKWLHTKCGDLGLSGQEWNMAVEQNSTLSGIINPSHMASVLRAVGFKGHVLYLGAYSHEGANAVKEWGPKLQQAGIAGEYFPLRSKDDLYPAMRDCGYARVDNAHSVFPGPHMMFPAYLQETISRLEQQNPPATAPAV